MYKLKMSDIMLTIIALLLYLMALFTQLHKNHPIKETFNKSESNRITISKSTLDSLILILNSMQKDLVEWDRSNKNFYNEIKELR